MKRVTPEKAKRKKSIQKRKKGKGKERGGGLHIKDTLDGRLQPERTERMGVVLFSFQSFRGSASSYFHDAWPERGKGP